MSKILNIVKKQNKSSIEEAIEAIIEEEYTLEDLIIEYDLEEEYTPEEIEEELEKQKILVCESCEIIKKKKDMIEIAGFYQCPECAENLL